jgi:hypothetical protein
LAREVSGRVEAVLGAVESVAGSGASGIERAREQLVGLYQ